MSPTHEVRRIHNTKKEAKLKDFKDPNEEMEDWIPEEAFKIAHQFRNQHAG